jgi:hypothetical protein
MLRQHRCAPVDRSFAWSPPTLALFVQAWLALTGVCLAVNVHRHDECDLADAIDIAWALAHAYNVAIVGIVVFARWATPGLVPNGLVRIGTWRRPLGLMSRRDR